ncbi:DUF4388 domain-containing protein [Desulfobacterales bacterium HSG16]|nr:DUF4388 domain-containing protein [Desulfobacterales bacterium HSG16]
MNISCEKCSTTFRLDEKLIKEKGTSVRCASCSHVFKVYPPDKTNKTDDPVSGKQPKVSKELLQFSHDLKLKKKNEGTFPGAAPIFRIIKEDNCPLYDLGDEFQLDGKIFMVPKSKAPCLILAKYVMKILAGNQNPKTAVITADPATVFDCGGCTGMIQFTYKHDKKSKTPTADMKPEEYIEALVELLGTFSIFKSLSNSELKELVSFLRIEQYDDSDTVLRKGEPGRRLFIVVSGKVEVVSDDGMTIAFMGGGEVFGEMSLLSGDPVGATIKVVEPTSVLYIDSNNFKQVLNEIPTLQLNFTRLLARRMAEINTARSEEFASGMTGKLSEMPPAELFQTLNVNQKTGVLTLKLLKESAYLSFREGELVRAKYRELEGEDAFFDLLKMREGRFKFLPGLSNEEMESAEIGDFMHLLMEGLRKIDEADKNFLKTMIPNL